MGLFFCFTPRAMGTNAGPEEYHIPGDCTCIRGSHLWPGWWWLSEHARPPGRCCCCCCTCCCTCCCCCCYCCCCLLLLLLESV